MIPLSFVPGKDVRSAMISFRPFRLQQVRVNTGHAAERGETAQDFPAASGACRVNMVRGI